MRKWITIHWTNPFKTYNKINRMFKPLTRNIKFGKLHRVGGFPVYLNHVSKILDIRAFDVQWKDKYNSPCFEHNPCVNITIFRRWKLLITWMFEDIGGVDHSMEYWETALSWIYYDYSLNLAIKENTGWYTLDNEGNREYFEYSLLQEPWQTMYNNDDLPLIFYNKYEKLV